MRNILYGVCGIGRGHVERQLPIIEHFAKDSTIVLFAYDTSLIVLQERFLNNPNVTVCEVSVPFYFGTKEGLDLGRTEAEAKKISNRGEINHEAHQIAEACLGKPDLVISDYEPESAQYAYNVGAPLVTIDQQSKYLIHGFPEELHGQTTKDEVARLTLFFPNATKRIACSFFSVPSESGEVTIVPPVIRDEIAKLNRQPAGNNRLLVYVSSVRDGSWIPTDVVKVLYNAKVEADIFVHEKSFEVYDSLKSDHIRVRMHGDSAFSDVLKMADGIVSSAGHSLLSEAMFLGIPVYAIPDGPFEQYMNAKVIQDGSFGVARDRLTERDLKDFVKNLEMHGTNIQKDSTVLMRGLGQNTIIPILENFL